MTNDEKISLLQQMIADFWKGRDGTTIDETQTMLDMISSVLGFGGECDGRYRICKEVLTMAKRLIDAVALETDLKRQYEEVFGNAKKAVNPDDFYVDKVSAYRASVVEAEQKGFFEYLKTRPTVDAVEVVRCKDCKWRDAEDDCLNPKCGKSWYGCPVPNEHYCSYGERKEG